MLLMVLGIMVCGFLYFLVVVFIILMEVKVNIMFWINISVGSKLWGKKLLLLVIKWKLVVLLFSGWLLLRNIVFMIKKVIMVSILISVN